MNNENKFAYLIQKCGVPKVILRYIMMNFLDFESIKNVILTVKEMSVLDSYSKKFLRRASKGYEWNSQKGHLDVVQWLYSHGDTRCTKQYWLERCICCKIFQSACENGHLVLAQWTRSLECKGTNIPDVYKTAFYNSCLNGYLDVAQWLYSLKLPDTVPHPHKSIKKYDITKKISEDHIFWNVCENGRLDVAQWLCSIVRISDFDYENGIVFACISGHLDVVQWLYPIAKNKYEYKNRCIKEAIKHKHIDIIQWLKQINNISNQDFFKIACGYDNIDIAQWAYSLGNVNAQGIIRKLKNPSSRTLSHHPSPRLREWLTSLQQPMNLKN